MAGLALALLVVLVLPSAQIELGAKTLQGLVGTYTDPPAGDHWDITYSYQGSVHTAYTGADGTQWNTDTPWTDGSSLNAQATVPGDGAVTQTNSGTVTATLTWVSPAGNPPPPSIKVLKSAGGGWYTQNAYGSPAHGNGSDGMGDPYADNGDGSGGSSFGGYNSNSGGTNAGPHPYIVTKDSSGGVVVVDDTLSANFTDAPVQGYSSGTFFTNVGFSVTVHAQPYDFHDAGHYDALGWLPGPVVDNTNGILTFYYDWKSTSGNKADLGYCSIHEITSYDGNTSGLGLSHSALVGKLCS